MAASEMSLGDPFTHQDVFQPPAAASSGESTTTTTMVGPTQNVVGSPMSPVNGISPSKDHAAGGGGGGGSNANMSSSAIFDSPISGDESSATPSRASRKQYSNRNRSEQALAIQREREERVRKIREQQEDERKRKLEELRQHALAAQKFREQQEIERRRHFEELRFRDEDKRTQVEERRRAIEAAERERREALLKKNMEREERIETRERQQQSQINFAFGSSTPRILGPGVDSTADVWGGARRSTSSSNVHSQLMTQSLYSRRSSERDPIDGSGGVGNNGRIGSTSGGGGYKRATSAHGLNQSQGEGDNELMTQSFHAGATPSGSAHRRRTDLMPTITASSVSGSVSGTRTASRVGNDSSRSSTPGRKMLQPSPGPRSTSAMSTDDSPAPSGVVRMRGGTPGHTRKPRPISIATTGIMSASMYEKGSKATPITVAPSTPSRPNALKLSTPDGRKKSSSIIGDDDDDGGMSASSSVKSSGAPRTRQTPKQVKATDAAKKLKKSPTSATPPQIPSSPAKTPTKSKAKPASETKTVEKSEPVNPPAQAEEPVKKEETPPEVPASVDPAVTPEEAHAETEEITEANASAVATSGEAEKEATPEEEASADKASREASPEDRRDDGVPEGGDADGTSGGKKIIADENEAKRRLAEKRREMQEKKRREAELEQERLLALEREAEERRLQEEEEERRAQEEADRLAAEARRQEEERLQRAIEEQERREREQREREEQQRREKEEAERRIKEESEKKRLELEEKLRLEEEERRARKKRIEEILAKTRRNAAPATTPMTSTTPLAEAAALGSPSKSGHGSDNETSAINNNNNGAAHEKASVNPEQSSTLPVSGGSHEAAMNLLNSTKSSESNFSQPDAANGRSSLNSNNGGDHGGSHADVEQILDLSESNGHRSKEDVPGPPIIAFEETRITSPKQEVSTADLLS